MLSGYARRANPTYVLFAAFSLIWIHRGSRNPTPPPASTMLSGYVLRTNPTYELFAAISFNMDSSQTA